MLQMKKLRKGKTRKLLDENKLKEKMSDDEYLELIKKRSTRTYTTIVANILWDYKQRQLSRGKKKWVISMLNKRLEENPSETETKQIEEVLKWFM